MEKSTVSPPATLPRDRARAGPILGVFRRPTVILTLVFLAVAPQAFGEDAEETCVLILRHTAMDGQGVSGEIHSRELSETLLCDRVARIDTYLEGTKGDPRTHTTALLFPEEGEAVFLLHGPKAIQHFGKEELDEKKKKEARDRIRREGAISDQGSKLAATGERETLAGYTARKYVATTRFGTATYRLADDATLLRVLNSERRFLSTMVEDVAFRELPRPDPASVPGFPLKTIETTSVPGVHLSITTTSSVKLDVPVDKKRLSVPSGYRPWKEVAPGLHGTHPEPEEPDPSATPEPKTPVPPG